MKQLRWPRSLVGPGLSALSALSILMATVGCGRTKAETAAPAEIAVDALATAAAATIARAHGAVWLLTSAGERQAVNGGALGEGEVLATGPDGGAVVVLGPGREVELKPNGRLKLRRQDGQLVVEVDSGNIVSRTPATQEVALSILTPFGITRVPAGSEARFGIAADRVRIDVALGQLEFTDAMGQAVTAHASESIEVKLGDVQLLQGPDGEAPGKPLELLLSAESGPLFVRRPGEHGFSPQRGGAGPAPAGTQYRIDAPDARARLLAPGLRVQLDRRAAGHIGEASRSPQGRRFALALDRGTATFALQANEAQELVLADQASSAPINLRATEATTVTVTAEAGGTSITVLAGAADIAVGESRQRLEAGARASVSGERVTLGKHAPSDVVLPTARGQRVYADLLGDVTLTWPAAAAPAGQPGASPGWFVEVARDSAFKDIVLAGRVAGNAVTLPAPSRTELHWRVNQGAGTEPLQGSVRFAPDSALSVLDLEHPRNLVSDGSPVTNVHFQGAPPALTFSYAAHKGAARYRLRLYRAEAPERPLVERVVAETRCAIAPGSLVEGNYLWHAVPLDAKGAELSGGRMNKLELVYDNALTRLAIGSPKQGQIPSGPGVNAQGAAPLGSKLYINGKLARLDDKGRFSAQVARSPTVVFRLVGKNGSESYWVRKLRLARGAPAAKARR